MSKNVLIVDDSKFSRNTNRKILEHLEYKIIGEAIDGLDGIEKCKELNPDIIVTDIEMPNLDGVEMIKKIREFNEDVKIIIVSSVVNSQVIEQAVKYKASVVKKPIKENRLQNAIALLSR